MSHWHKIFIGKTFETLAETNFTMSTEKNKEEMTDNSTINAIQQEELTVNSKTNATSYAKKSVMDKLKNAFSAKDKTNESNKTSEMEENKTSNETIEDQTLNNNNVNEENIEESIATAEVKEEVVIELTDAEKLAELNDRYLRLYSEFDNYRKRTNKEKIDLISNASEGMLKSVIPTLDDFERAIANNEKVEDIEAIKEGFSLIYNKLKTTLEARGLKPMETLSKPFNSDLHEAIANVPGDEKMRGLIIDDVEKGYFLNDKVIRFAKVVVGQ
jgi:molecular chaperone GrpE